MKESFLMDMFYRYSSRLLLISVAVFKSEVIPGIKNSFPIGEIIPIIHKKYTDKYLCGKTAEKQKGVVLAINFIGKTMLH